MPFHHSFNPPGAPDPGCPWCLQRVSFVDDSIIQKDGRTWHAKCHDLYDTQQRIARGKTMPNPSKIEVTQAEPGQILRTPPIIEYHMSHHEFMLKIPVEALAGMSQDSHTRMLAMLNDWICRHKPTPVAKQETKP